MYSSIQRKYNEKCFKLSYGNSIEVCRSAPFGQYSWVERIDYVSFCIRTCIIISIPPLQDHMLYLLGEYSSLSTVAAPRMSLPIAFVAHKHSIPT